jgi:hypothetical protein
LFDRYSGELAVSPRGIAIAEVEQAASGLHRITKDRARRQQLTPMLKGGPPCFTLFLNFWKANENSHPQPEKTPNGINAAAIN